MSNILCTQVTASTAANSKRTEWIRFDVKETGHKKQRYKKRTRRLLEVYLVMLHWGFKHISAKKSRDDRTPRAKFEHCTNKSMENEYDAMRNIKIVQLQSYDSHYSSLRCVFQFGLTWMIRVYEAVELWKECSAYRFGSHCLIRNNILFIWNSSAYHISMCDLARSTFTCSLLLTHTDRIFIRFMHI